MSHSEIHFEHIWNAAEDLGTKFPQESIESIVKKIQETIDNIPQMANLPSRQAEIVGEILFDLCAITNQLNINSAAALRWAIENRKAKLLDPDEEQPPESISNVP